VLYTAAVRYLLSSFCALRILHESATTHAQSARRTARYGGGVWRGTDCELRIAGRVAAAPLPLRPWLALGLLGAAAWLAEREGGHARLRLRWAQAALQLQQEQAGCSARRGDGERARRPAQPRHSSLHSQKFVQTKRETCSTKTFLRIWQNNGMRNIACGQRSGSWGSLWGS
jgi:hypothetical protein